VTLLYRAAWALGCVGAGLCLFGVVPLGNGLVGVACGLFMISSRGPA